MPIFAGILTDVGIFRSFLAVERQKEAVLEVRRFPGRDVGCEGQYGVMGKYCSRYSRRYRGVEVGVCEWGDMENRYLNEALPFRRCVVYSNSTNYLFLCLSCQGGKVLALRLNWDTPVCTVHVGGTHAR
jgi:hypothetical protein